MVYPLRRCTSSRNNLVRSAFTLIELLVVIAIIAILSIVVVLTLNPAQLLMQSRDSNRISDMSTLNSALGIYSAQGGLSLGSSNVVYVSIPDPTATSTAGDQCQGLGLVSLPTGYSYQCAASSTYRSTNGTGWIPVNFSSMAAGSPLSILPIDPAQSSSSRLYYTYTTNGSQYELTSNMESAKYQLGGSNDVIGNDGGTLASVYEKGSKLGLEPLDYGDTGLVGLWSFEEGSSSIAYDYSGNNATGSWNGTATGTNGYYSPGKIGNWAGAFDGTSTNVSVTSTNILNFGASNSLTITAWFNTTQNTGATNAIINKWTGAANGQYDIRLNSSGHITGEVYTNPTDITIVSGSGYNNGFWHLVTFVRDKSTNLLYLYVDGVSAASPVNDTTGNLSNSSPLQIGVISGHYFAGIIDDVRIYNRALTAAQIAAMYTGGK